MPASEMSPAQAVAGVLAVAVLLSQFGVLRLLWVGGLVRIYAVQSLAVAAFAALVGWTTQNPDLYLLACLTLAIKCLGVPALLRAIVRRLEVDERIPATVKVPLSLLVAIALGALGFAAAGRLVGSAGPELGLQVGMATVLVGFLVMVSRANAIAQLVGFLTLENGIFVATVALAPGMPLIVAVLLLLDILLPALAFMVVIRVLARRHRSVHTVELNELRG